MDSDLGNAGGCEQSKPAVLWINYDTLWFSPARPRTMIAAPASSPDGQQRRGARHAHHSHPPVTATKTKWLPRDSQTGEKRRYIPPKDPRQKMSKKHGSSPGWSYDPRVPPVAWSSGVHSDGHLNMPEASNYTNDQTMAFKTDNTHQLDSREHRQFKSKPPSYYYKKRPNDYEVDMQDGLMKNFPYVQIQSSSRYRDSENPKRVQRQYIDKCINQGGNRTPGEINAFMKNYEDCDIIPASGYTRDQGHSEDMYFRSQPDSSNVSPTIKHEVDSREQRSRYSEDFKEKYLINRQEYSEQPVRRPDQFGHQMTGGTNIRDDVLMSVQLDHSDKTDPNSDTHNFDDRSFLVGSNRTSNENTRSVDPLSTSSDRDTRISLIHTTQNTKSQFSPTVKQTKNDYFDGEETNRQSDSSNPFKHLQEDLPAPADPVRYRTSDIQIQQSAKDIGLTTVSGPAYAHHNDQTDEDTEPILTASSIIKRFNRLSNEHKEQEQRIRRSTESIPGSDSLNSVATSDVRVTVSSPTVRTSAISFQKLNTEIEQTRDYKGHQLPENSDDEDDSAFVVDGGTNLFNLNHIPHSSCNTHRVLHQSRHNPCDTDHIPHNEDLHQVNDLILSNSDQEDRAIDNGLHSTENDAEIARCLHESLAHEYDEDDAEVNNSDSSQDVEPDIQPQVVLDVEPPRVCAIRGLTERELSVLSSSKLQKIPITLKCEICWDSYKVGDSVRHLICAHFFHVKCIDIWLKRTATCPVCRTVLVDLFLPDRLSTHRTRRRRRCVIL